MYDERIKENAMRYMATNREKLGLNLPIGTKDCWKSYAAIKGISVTELITHLIEQDMKKNNWNSKF